MHYRLWTAWAIVVWMAWAGPAWAGPRVALASGEVLYAESLVQIDAGYVMDHAILGRLFLPTENVVSVDQPGEAAPAAESEARTTAENKPRSAPERVETHQARTKPEPEPTADPPAPKPAGLFGTPLLAGWESRLSLGMSGAAGNTDRGSFTGQFQTSHKNEQHRTAFVAQSFYRVSEGQTTQNQGKVALTRDWLLPQSPWFVFANSEYQYNQFREYRHRTSGFGGLGYAFVDQGDLEVLGRAGAGLSYEFGEINQLIPEAVFGGSAVSWDINRHHELSAATTIYPDLERRGQSRWEASFDWIVDLPDTSGLKLKLGMVNEYESQTRGDEKHNDFRYYTALVLGF